MSHKLVSLYIGEGEYYTRIDVDNVIAELERQIAEKDEADKVIEDLEADYKEACDRLQTANLIKDEQLAATRHQKYKRCLAMARWCASRAVVWDIDGNEKKSEWYWKWKERWKDLAKKFKEAK